MLMLMLMLVLMLMLMLMLVLMLVLMLGQWQTGRQASKQTSKQTRMPSMYACMHVDMDVIMETGELIAHQGYECIGRPSQKKKKKNWSKRGVIYYTWARAVPLTCTCGRPRQKNIKMYGGSCHRRKASFLFFFHHFTLWMDPC